MSRTSYVEVDIRDHATNTDSLSASLKLACRCAAMDSMSSNLKATLPLNVDEDPELLNLFKGELLTLLSFSACSNKPSLTPLSRKQTQPYPFQPSLNMPNSRVDTPLRMAMEQPSRTS